MEEPHVLCEKGFRSHSFPTSLQCPFLPLLHRREKNSPPIIFLPLRARPTLTLGIPAGRCWYWGSRKSGLEKRVTASWMHFTWLATTDSTSMEMRLNSSKQPHAPTWVRPVAHTHTQVRQTDHERFSAASMNMPNIKRRTRESTNPTSHKINWSCPASPQVEVVIILLDNRVGWLLKCVVYTHHGQDLGTLSGFGATRIDVKRSRGRVLCLAMCMLRA